MGRPSTPTFRTATSDAAEDDDEEGNAEVSKSEPLSSLAADPLPMPPLSSDWQPLGVSGRAGIMRSSPGEGGMRRTWKQVEVAHGRRSASERQLSEELTLDDGPKVCVGSVAVENIYTLRDESCNV
jgi:hypothetical protein